MLKQIALQVFIISSAYCQNWTQWGQNARHTGTVNVSGQKLEAALAEFKYDPLAEAIRQDAGGDLLVHYQAPIIDGNDVFIEGCFNNTNIYKISRYKCI